MNDPNQNPANVDSDQVATQPVSTTPPAANEGDASTPLYDGMQQPKDPNEDDETPVATHNVFEQNQNAADASQAGGTDNVYPVDGDDQASIDEALKKHHEAHGA